MKTHRSILDPSFRYTDSVSTNIAATFKRIRREQAEAAKIAAKPPVVVPMRNKAKP